MNLPLAAPPDETSYPPPEVDRRDEAALALLGHDLRAALSDVIGGLHLITAETLAPATRRQFHRVRVAAEVLAQLLEHGLAVMPGEGDPTVLADMDLKAGLADLLDRWSGRAEAKGLDFQLLAAPDLPAHIKTDGVSLERILSNLIGNAIKYSDLGTVRCTIARKGERWFVVTIADQGPGFPSSVLSGPHGFHPRPAGMVQPVGGMGLHIAEMMAERMGGRLSLRNLPAGAGESRLGLGGRVEVF